MTKIPGRLIVDLLPDGKLRLTFLPNSGGKNAATIRAIDLDVAMALFMACGLSAERAAALRTEVIRNNVATLVIGVDEEVAAKFRHTFPPN
jgi:hypothetical protein